jgi:hypothetical protein
VEQLPTFSAMQNLSSTSSRDEEGLVLGPAVPGVSIVVGAADGPDEGIDVGTLLGL